MQSILEEIEEEILKEQEEELKKDTQDVATNYPAYLEDNKVTMPLGEYMALYETAKEAGRHLDALVELIIKSTELDYNKEHLQIDRYTSQKITDYVKQIAPLHYVERYEALIEREQEGEGE